MSQNLRNKLHTIIFEADTPAGKWFDILIMIIILLSVLVVALESVPSIEFVAGKYLRWLEWGFTVIFTLEYFARIYALRKPTGYIFSFYGLIDLFSFLPTYFSLFLAGTQALLVIRVIRLLRIFRILKLVRFLGEASKLVKALRESVPKIIVFIITVACLSIIVGAMMYLIEGPEHGFTSIPRSIYWTIVTLTTVGYGDIAPQTPLGQFLAALLMIVGYGIIAVPTGIVTARLVQQQKIAKNTQVCPNCGYDDHDDKATYCHQCGSKL